jgi:hypothetical protein
MHVPALYLSLIYLLYMRITDVGDARRSAARAAPSVLKVENRELMHIADTSTYLLA